MARSSTDAPDSPSASPGGGKPGTSSGGGQHPPGLSQSFAGPAAGKGTGMLPDAMDAMTEHLKQSGERLSATASKLRSQTVSPEAYGLVGTGVSGKTNESISNAADTTQNAADCAEDAGAAVKASKETTQLHDDKSAGKLREIGPDTDVRPHPSEPASTGPQGHRGPGPDLRDSQNGDFAVGGNGKAYADEATIGRYADELSRRTRITLEAGDKLEGTSKREIRPVYKDRESVPPHRDPDREPIAGESADTRQAKLDRYHDSLDRSMQEIFDKQIEVRKAFKDAEGKWFPAESPEKSVTADHARSVFDMANKKMGSAWATKNGSFLMNEKSISADDYNRVFDRMIQDHGKFVDAEKRATADGLTMTMPNDCRGAAEQIIGGNAAELSKVNDNPAVGDNYYKKFAEDSGWDAHYGSVVAKDGNTDLSFETAADVTVPANDGKSFGYFEMYTRDGKPEESFGGIVDQKNEEYKGRKARVVS